MLEREFIVITCRFRNHFAPISRPSSRTLSVRATETRRIISPSDGQSRLTRVHRFHWQSCFNGNRLYRVFVPIFSTRLSINPTNYGTIKVPSNDNDFSRIRFQIFFNFFLYYIVLLFFFFCIISLQASETNYAKLRKIFLFQVALDSHFSYYLEFYCWKIVEI